MIHKNWLTLLIVPLLFFIVSFATINHYGISWDEPIHFFRGQAYLNFFLTGKTDYSDFSGRRSHYQNDSLRAEYFFTTDGGHPPLNGELAALTNFIFYQKLGILGDLQSLHLFNVLISTVLVAVVVIFAYQAQGIFAALISGVTISLYPLFFGESHFNIKDPAEAAFYTLTIWTFWNSLKNFSWKWLLASEIGFGIALATKFNILFLPFIIVPYLLIRCTRGENLKKMIWSIPKKYWVTFFLAPVVILAIFYGSWPYLWQHPRGNLFEVINYYRGIGTGSGYATDYRFLKVFNTFPLTWVIYTTPPWVLILGIIGVLTIQRPKSKDWVEGLWLIWLIVPILRVSMPNTAIYGGVRQIMEYIPALALIAGLGAKSLKDFLLFILSKKFNKSTNSLFISIFLVMLFIPQLLIMIKLHPNENVYFNFIIGGLKGAYKADVPYWGNSFGNAYLQAVNWLNTNAPLNSSLALIQGTGTNIPRFQLREDLILSNVSWSGVNRNGEYIVELTHQDPVHVYPYMWDYVRNFLKPVYEVKVDGVAIAKVWKNDLEHTQAKWRKSEIIPEIEEFSQTNKEILIQLKKDYQLSRMYLYYTPDECQGTKGDVYLSLDARKWGKQKESLPVQQVAEEGDGIESRVKLFFPGSDARFIRIVADNPQSCLLKAPKVKFYAF